MVAQGDWGTEERTALRSFLLSASGDRHTSSGEGNEDSRRAAWEQIANELRIWRQEQQEETVERSAHSCELEAWRMRHHPAWQDVDIPWIIGDNDEIAKDVGVAHRPVSGRGSSQYRGVCRSSNGKRWQVKLGSTYIGMYDDEIEAAEAYDKVAVEHYGASTAQLNFPQGCGSTEGNSSSKRTVPSERSTRTPHSRKKAKTANVAVGPKPTPVGFRIVKSWSELRPACERLEAPELTTEAKSVLAKKMKEHGGEQNLKWQVCTSWNLSSRSFASLQSH